MNEKIVKLINLINNQEISAILKYTTDYPTKIVLSYKDKQISAENYDLLETLIDIRKKLNKENLDILVNGSRKNISSSPMLRDASSGAKTYLTRLGIQARIGDIVSIFEPISQEYYSSLQEQEEFHEIWMKSLKPSKDEIKEAKKHPNGWVYRFDRPFSEDEIIPPEAIIGAWKVDKNGNLTGEWKLNENYIPLEIRENK